MFGIYHSLAKMGPWVVHFTLCSDRGWADICNIAAFHHEKATMFIITTYNRILHTNIPTQFKLNSI